VDWLPEIPAAALDARLQGPGPRTPLAVLHESLPERLARALCAASGVDPTGALARLPRPARRALVASVKDLVLPVTGDRGFAHAEATAGGVPLSELRLHNLESRVRPGLHLCGELCDVDGRLGGFNFQWAWASGYVAGTGAAADRAAATPGP
jgi:predicted flavoprotein YhiN